MVRKKWFYTCRGTNRRFAYSVVEIKQNLWHTIFTQVNTEKGLIVTEKRPTFLILKIE